ncbi:MAG: nickel-dependent lactate racemase [Pirellulaceae bacterium]
MRVRLEYGRSGLDVDLPERHVVRTLAYKDSEPISDPAANLRDLLNAPNGTPPLSQLAADKKSACILICDITRPVPNELILSQVLPELHLAGISKDRILILVATGLHRANDESELREMVGDFVYENYRIENHDGLASDEHVYLGESPRAVPIWIDRRFVDAELKITTGLIEPHMMAGFSGGRKVICPGIAGLETIKVWHSPDFLEHPNADCGVIDGNPVHEENTWIAKKAGCDFIVNVVIDAQRRPLKFVAGDMETAFYEGVEFVRSVVTDKVEQPVDIVVTSSAGYPLDTTFYQSVKGMRAALRIIKPGGTIIVAASLTEGIGSEPFQQLFKDHATLEAFMDAIVSKRYFKMDQWQLEELAKVRRKASVTMVSDGIAPEVLEKFYVDTAISVEAAVAEAIEKHGSEATIAVIPKGPYVLSTLA